MDAQKLTIHHEIRLLRTPTRNPAELYLLQLKAGPSRESQRSGLLHVARWFSPGSTIELFPWGKLRWEHLQALRAYLAETFSAASANRMLCAVRQTLRAAWRLGELDLDELERARDIRTVEGHRLMRGRALERHELAQLVAETGRDHLKWRGRRDAALLALIFGAGLRRSEVAGLDVERLEREEGRIFVRVIGKGNKERRVPLPHAASDAIEKYLHTTRGEEPGPLFRGRKNTRGRLRAQSIALAILKLADRAKVKRLSPHDGRRTYISELFDVGADVSCIQKLAGHLQATTTIRYDRRPERARARAVDLLELPLAVAW